MIDLPSAEVLLTVFGLGLLPLCASSGIFSALLAAFITILSKLAEDWVRLFGWGVTNIFKIFLRSSSCVGLIAEDCFLWDGEPK